MIGNPLRWLGGKLDIKIEVETLAEGGGIWDESSSSAGWDEATWALLDWADITQYVEALRIARGQPRWDSRFQAGSLSLTLDNTTGLFTPDVGQEIVGIPWRPGRLVRVMVNPDPTDPDTWVYLFSGRIDESTDAYTAATQDVTATVRALDALGDLHAFNPPALSVATGVQDTDERVEAALDAMGWDALLRDLQTGLHTMQTSFLAQTTLEECQRAAEAEGGALFAGTDNSIVFKARDWLITDTRSTTIQGHLGYDSEQVEDVPYAEVTALKVSWDMARIENDIQFARTGSTVYRVEDSASQVLFGKRSHQRLDLQNNLDAEVEYLADRYLAAYKDLRYRVESVTIVANDDTGNEDLNRLFYDAQFGDLVALNVDTGRGWGYQLETHIIGISHDITAHDWSVTFTLDDSAIAAEESSSS